MAQWRISRIHQRSSWEFHFGVSQRILAYEHFHTINAGISGRWGSRERRRITQWRWPQYYHTRHTHHRFRFRKWVPEQCYLGVLRWRQVKVEDGGPPPGGGNGWLHILSIFTPSSIICVSVRIDKSGKKGEEPKTGILVYSGLSSNDRTRAIRWQQYFVVTLFVTSESASVSIIFSKLIRCLSLSTQFSISDTLSLSLHHSSASCNIPTVTYNGRIYSH